MVVATKSLVEVRLENEGSDLGGVDDEDDGEDEEPHGEEDLCGNHEVAHLRRVEEKEEGGARDPKGPKNGQREFN